MKRTVGSSCGEAVAGCPATISKSTPRSPEVATSSRERSTSVVAHEGHQFSDAATGMSGNGHSTTVHEIAVPATSRRLPTSACRTSTAGHQVGVRQEQSASAGIAASRKLAFAGSIRAIRRADSLNGLLTLSPQLMRVASQ